MLQGFLLFTTQSANVLLFILLLLWQCRIHHYADITTVSRAVYTLLLAKLKPKLDLDRNVTNIKLNIIMVIYIILKIYSVKIIPK